MKLFIGEDSQTVGINHGYGNGYGDGNGDGW